MPLCAPMPPVGPASAPCVVHTRAAPAGGCRKMGLVPRSPALQSTGHSKLHTAAARHRALPPPRTPLPPSPLLRVLQALMRQYAPGLGAGVFLERAVSRKASGGGDVAARLGRRRLPAPASALPPVAARLWRGPLSPAQPAPPVAVIQRPAPLAPACRADRSGDAGLSSCSGDHSCGAVAVATAPLNAWQSPVFVRCSGTQTGSSFLMAAALTTRPDPNSRSRPLFPRPISLPSPVPQFRHATSLNRAGKV